MLILMKSSSQFKLLSSLAISEQGFIFNPSTGDSFSTNITGAEILKLMKEGKSTKEITQILSSKFMVEENQVEKDLTDFYSLLRDNFLIQNV
jgi:hypothetical protein